MHPKGAMRFPVTNGFKILFNPAVYPVRSVLTQLDMCRFIWQENMRVSHNPIAGDFTGGC